MFVNNGMYAATGYATADQCLREFENTTFEFDFFCSRKPEHRMFFSFYFSTNVVKVNVS